MLTLQRKRKIILASKGASKSYQDTIKTTSGAVAYWPLDEVSGTTAFDKVGTRHGTISGGVTLNQAGVNGSKCMVFDGTGAITTLPSLTVPLVSTIEAWIRTTAPPASHMPMLSNRAGGTVNTLYFAVQAWIPQRLYLYTNSGAQTSTANFANEWHHAVCVLSPTDVTWYLDGVGEAPVPLVRGATEAAAIALGYDAVAPAWWNGKLQDIAIYNRALTPAEIQSHYTKRLEGPSSLLTGLTSYWSMDSDFQDKVGTNHLTQTGGVTRVAGKLGNASDFESSSSQYLSHADPTPLGDEDFTYTLWFKLESLGPEKIMIGKDSNVTGRSYILETIGTSLNWQVFNGTPSCLIGLNDTDWHFVVAWNDATADTLNLQVDNGAVTSTSTAGLGGAPINLTPLAIGARTYPTVEAYFDGLIDEVGLWRRVLTADERTRLWNNGNGLAHPF